MKKMLSALVILCFLCFSTAYAHDPQDEHSDQGASVAIIVAVTVVAMVLLLAHHHHDRGWHGRHWGYGGYRHYYPAPGSGYPDR
jgi:hypothetical protein